MKQIWIFICLFILGACSDDEKFLDVSVSESAITFEAVNGGAVMRYDIPASTNIYIVQARYTDAQGQEIKVSSSVFLDSLELMGFNEERQNVPVEITFKDKNNVESEPMRMTFNTLSSVPYMFLDSVRVESGWNGVTVSYNFNPSGNVSGLANVFYVGTNAYTQETDTLFVDDFVIEKGTNEVFFPVDFEYEENTIIVRTEDYRGYNAHTRQWDNVRSYASEQLPSSEFVLEDPEGWSQEDETARLGMQYLTDGDKNGRILLENSDTYDCGFTYLTNAGGADGSYVLVDMKTARVPASVRLYGMFQLDGIYLPEPLYYNYRDCLPCSIKVYASNDQTEWVELGSYNQNPTITPAAGEWGSTYRGSIASIEQLEALDPMYCEITCKLQDSPYRYLKVEVNDTFDTNPGVFGNEAGYVSYHELEVYVEKND